MRDIKDVRADRDAAQVKRDRLSEELRQLHNSAGDKPLTDGEQERWDRLTRGVANADADIDRLREEERAAVTAQIEAGPAFLDDGDGIRAGAPPQHRKSELTRTHLARPARSREEQEVIERALKVVDAAHRDLSPASGDRVQELLRAEVSEHYDPGYVARRVLITETPEYRSAFMQAMAAGQRNMPAILTGPEINALRQAQELERLYDRGFKAQRAMSIFGSDSSGLAVPTLIDPTIIITSGAADAPMLRVCRVVDVTTNVWRGISSAGMVWSYDTEAAAVSDDSPALDDPSAAVHTARGFIPFSIEASMDQVDFYGQMARLIDQGYTDLVAVKTMTGSGTGEPFGIFTALDASTFDEVATTTDGSFGGEDVFKVWNSLPERYRGRSTWVMSVHVQSAIRKFAAATTTGSAYFTIDLTEGEFRINNRPVIVTDYAPTFAGAVPGTTGAANILAVGDWENSYVFARRAGMSVEPIPHLFDVTNNRPTAQRGLFAWARNGANIVNNSGARLLQNQ